MAVPQFGPGRPVAVRPIDSPPEQGGGTPKWVWYAGGGVIAIAVIMLFLRRGGGTSTSSGSPLTSNPTAGTANLDNLAAAIQALQSQLGNMKPPTAPAPTPNPNPITNPPSGPPPSSPSSGPVGVLGAIQIHQGDTIQSVTDYWNHQGFTFTAQQFAGSNAGTPFLPGNTWYIFAPGGHL